MAIYEYKVIPAPTKGQKVQGIKMPEARFAHTIEELLNAQAANGWEYVRTDILPSDERSGLTGTQTVYRTLLVFRRAKGGGPQDPANEVISTAQSVAEAILPDRAPARRREPSLAPAQPAHADPAPKPDTPQPKPDAPEPDTPDAPEPDAPGPAKPD
ncbi:DUF4177 domain-containing protein [Roseovarius sp. M141]|uniref:DUF4177 domain-containing protein n=1 Tax=Roseovarius sp. M141 TaxID=2583806 RepID=UPI0020CD46D5|nr:DUF4177 domain-containing protein [Roseovarius sp. M141]MCQ0093613.1 DUF4177 domain-containing protein [Roseovarius sp. M141]